MCSGAHRDSFIEALNSRPDKEPQPLVWVASSGSVSPKYIGLTYHALRASAQAVNQYLRLVREDRWLNTLSLDHVGGLGTWFRAHELGSQWIDMSHEKWNPKDFRSHLVKFGITVTSLVPTQVFDLVNEGLMCPNALRLIVVGGGALNFDLYLRGRSLGWPLLPSFGMSELASQVATASPDSLLDPNRGEPPLHLLPHVDAKVGDDQSLILKSPSLCAVIASLGEKGWKFRSLDSGSWYETEDRVELIGSVLKPLGRKSDQIKILGELVDLQALNGKLRNFLLQRSASPEGTHIISLPDKRRGNRLVLVSSDFNQAQLEGLSAEFNQMVLGFERIVSVEVVKEWPRSDLGKIQWARVRDLLRRT